MAWTSASKHRFFSLLGSTVFVSTSLLAGCSGGRATFEDSKKGTTDADGSPSQVEAGTEPTSSMTAGSSSDSETETSPAQSSDDEGTSGNATGGSGADGSADDGTGSVKDDDSSGGQPPDDCADGCSIGSKCYSDAEPNPENPCQVCTVSTSNSDWSDNDGKSCSDDRYCTVDDYCAGGACVGDERVCDDGVACNGAETCDDEESKCVAATSTCEEGELCDVDSDTCSADCAGCVIDGSCYAEGSPSPTNSCLVCDPDKATDDWSMDVGAECDDGDACTEDDVCDGAGECAGSDVVCTDDDEECGAKRTCDPGTGMCAEQFPGGSVSCNDLDACTTDDKCDGEGGCNGTPSTDDAAGCECLSAAECNDNIACTTDTCTDGKCTQEVSAGKCLIGGTCYDEDDPAPNNDCLVCDPALAPKNWTNASNSTSCDDGLWCNGDNDLCNGLGACAHAYPDGARCAGTTGACEVKTCDEAKKNCFAPADEVCAEATDSGCAMDSACGADVYTWPVEYVCSGTSALCGTTPNPREDLATVKAACGTSEACEESSDTCKPKLGCTTSYCVDGLCFTTRNAPVTGAAMTYAQEAGRTYCSGLDYLGNQNWRLPDVEEIMHLVTAEQNGCYWPPAMGNCNDELWTGDDSQSFAPWVGTTALQIGSTPLYIRCVVNE